MICTEVAEMYEFAKKVIAPVGAAVILAALFYPLCVENGQCDYLKLWIFMGIPFGVHKMFLWIIPKGFDIGGTVGVCPGLASFDGSLLSGENGFRRDLKAYEGKSRVKFYRRTSE